MRKRIGLAVQVVDNVHRTHERVAQVGPADRSPIVDAQVAGLTMSSFPTCCTANSDTKIVMLLGSECCQFHHQRHFGESDLSLLQHNEARSWQ